MGELDLLRAFDVYLWIVLVVGVALRAGHHLRVVKAAVDVGVGCPRLRALVADHRALLLSRAIIVPLMLTGGILVADVFVGQLVWPAATVPGGTLLEDPRLLAGLAPLLALMLLVDVQGIALFTRVDPDRVVAQATRAERFLKADDALRTVSFGLLGIRGPVARRVRTALGGFVGSARVTLWHSALQGATRLAVGACLWMWWALGPLNSA